MIKGNKYTYLNYLSAYELINNLFKKDNPFDEVIKETFDIMGNLLDVDVLEISICDHSYSGFINKYTWNKPEIVNKRFMNMSSIPINVTMFDVYKDYEYIKLNDTRKLFDEEKDLRELYKFLHIKSICIFPIRVKKEVVAELVFKSHLKRRKFTDEQISFISKCHKLIQKQFIIEYRNIMLGINKKFFLKLIDNFIYPMALLDFNFNLIKVNKEFENFFEITNNDILKQDFIDFITESERNKVLDIFGNVTVNKKDYYEVFKMVHNEKKIIRIIPFPLTNHNFKLLGIMFKDVTKVKIEEKRLIKMAYFDLTTNLYNRNYFKQVCQELDSMDYKSLGVIIFDIDNLNQINDIYGHDKGDKIIINVSGILRNVFEDDYLVSQIGGDEFIIFMLNQTEEDIQRKIKLVNSIIEKQHIGNCISSGYSFTDIKIHNIFDLIHQADSYLHVEKRNKSSFEKEITNRPTI